jgi:hypothetical protein
MTAEINQTRLYRDLERFSALFRWLTERGIELWTVNDL